MGYIFKTWEEKTKEIRIRIDSDGIESCLSWDVIRQSMGTDENAFFDLLDFFENNVIKIKEIENIIEVGAGTGMLCREIFKRKFIGKYWIFDFPEMQQIQKYVLKDLKINYIDNLQSLPICKDLFISSCALEEFPKELQNDLIEYSLMFNHHLLRFNGEGALEKLIEKKTWHYKQCIVPKQFIYCR